MSPRFMGPLEGALAGLVLHEVANCRTASSGRFAMIYVPHLDATQGP
jgi:hypothetical protein